MKTRDELDQMENKRLQVEAELQQINKFLDKEIQIPLTKFRGIK